ncbi:acyl-CoA thioester hydrolase/BAAT C-terminal domain-containing protein [Nonlabens ulvanivorans]|uniref:acyl-CoA thioester hydrolase/BAAT C-terminal domain-containing protein n=1 Tax=Nonlabens ulvanivorans TaxID=906888 RepID=UPI0037C61A7B
MKKKLIILIGVLIALILCYLVVDYALFSGIRSKSINENGFQGSYFTKENIENKTAVILIGGGVWGDYWAQEFAQKGLVGLSLPYSGKENLPRLPEEIKLEYFEKAIQWLAQQKSVNPEKIVVMGASRNAELALLIASTYPEITSGVIAYAPSSVSWSNTVLPYNSDTIKPSWTYQGIDVPYIPMKKIKGNNTSQITFLNYWEDGLQKSDIADNAAIKVEQINGPILLFSGLDDQVWPSAKMAHRIEERLKKHHFNFKLQNVKYKNAGHLISNIPEQRSENRLGTLNINGKTYTYNYGGTNDGDFKAKIDAKIKLTEYLLKLDAR